MRKVFLLALSFTFWLVSFAQKQKNNCRKRLTLTRSGRQLLTINWETGASALTCRYNNNPGIVMMSLHDDEATAIETSRQVLRKAGGYLIKINNDSARFIRFKLNGVTYKFDPNRIFTETGIISSLKQQATTTR